MLAAVTTAVSVTAHELLTGFQTDWASLLADCLLAGLFGLYLFGVRRIGRGQWPALRTVAFATGLFLVFVAVGSGLAAYDDDNFSAHVVQHVLLMMAAPPLIVAGRPLAVLVGASGRRTQSRIVRLLRSRTLRAILRSGTAVSILYFGAMWAFFLTPLYPWSIQWESLHDSIHVACVLVGLVYWQFVIDPAQAGRRQPHHRRVLAVLFGMPFETYLGFVLHGLDHSLGPGTTVSSVQAGGEVFWFMSMLASGVAFAGLVLRWVLEDERRAARADTREAQAAEPSLPALSGMPAVATNGGALGSAEPPSSS